MAEKRRRRIFTIIVFVTLASLDNTAIALIPSMLFSISEDLQVAESSLGWVTASVILVAALTAVGWGYVGDQRQRKGLLFSGTLIWAAGTWLTATSRSYTALFWWQTATAVGLGSIASIGFSVVSDLVAPRRRGLAMSFWGLAQGFGGFVGINLASQVGASDWGKPLKMVAIAGVVAAILYLFTYEPKRGASEPELQDLFTSDSGYEHVIEKSQLSEIATRATNRWLILQGLTAQVAYGSLLWVPFLYQAKVQEQGYDIVTSMKVGGILAAIFQVGALTSILAGAIGDRWQRRNLRARAWLSAIGILGAIPFFFGVFFIPLRGLEVTPGGSTPTLIVEVLRLAVSNIWVAGAVLLSITAITFTSADSPNWFALISDVNLPEHRGTVFGVGNLANGVGRATGNGLTGLTASTLLAGLPPPLNYATGLALFQVFFLPTGYCYWRASQTSPVDIEYVRATLQERGRRPVNT